MVSMSRLFGFASGDKKVAKIWVYFLPFLDGFLKMPSVFSGVELRGNEMWRHKAENKVGKGGSAGVKKFLTPFLTPPERKRAETVNGISP